MASKDEDKNYAYLNRLSAEQLEELLRTDIESPEPSNSDIIFYILEELEKREGYVPVGCIPNEDAAWIEFQQYYNIPDGVGNFLYPCKSEDDKNNKGEQMISSQSSSPTVIYIRRWFRTCMR